MMRRSKKDNAACKVDNVLEMLFRSLSCCYERLAKFVSQYDRFMEEVILHLGKQAHQDYDKQK